MDDPKASLLVALPTYDGRRHNAMATRELQGIRNLSVRFFDVQSSLLALGFNKAWAAALNASPTFFMMLHEDIIPVEKDWMVTLFDEMYRRRASVISVVSPIKTAAGLTSTAVETDDPWNPRRLSMTEVYERPETWTEPGLLVNTGLMLVDFREAWTEKVHFEIHDRIVRKGDEWEAEVQPEDWNFSRAARANGATIYATRKVLIQHIGPAGYDNGCAWGTELTDPKYAASEAVSA